MKVLIVGGGIGAMTTALALRAAGIGAAVFEQAREIREVGIGIDALSHAVKRDDGRTLHGALVGAGS